MLDSIYCDRCGRYLGGEFDLRYGKFKCKCGHTTVVDLRQCVKILLTDDDEMWDNSKDQEKRNTSK